MTRKKHGLSVEIERINEDNVKGLAVKNLKIENLSIPEITLITGLLIQQILKENEAMEECFEKDLNDFFIRLTLEGVLSGQIDLDRMSNMSQVELLEHCFKMEHKGED